MSRSSEHEASSSIDDCNKSLSTVKFSYRIDWGLLVEGKTDEVFYKKVTDRLNTFHGSPESYENANIPQIVADKRKNGKHFFGIIDADYKPHIFSDEVKKYMRVTDANSLETMMIKYYGITDFDKIVEKLIKTKYPSNKYNCKEKLSNPVVEMSVKWAYKIGVLRNFNESRKCLSINRIKERSNYYFDYLNSQKKPDNHVEISFELEKYLNELITTNTGTVTKEDLEIEIENTPYTEENAYILCQGHDIIDFIEAVIKKYGASIAKDSRDSYKIIHKRRGRLDKVSIMEYDILEKYDISKFEKAPLYQWLSEIDKKYVSKEN